MRCPDMVMSAMSYHPHYVRGEVARAYWSFVAEWQHDNGGLHRMGGQWYLMELASRFRFRSVHDILTRSLPLAVRRQRKDGGFQADYPAESACQVALAYARHGMLKSLLTELRYDPIPLIDSLETPFGVKTRREALEQPRDDDGDLSKHLSDTIARNQMRDGSWEGLIVATVQALHDLLDCGALPQSRAARKACDWLLAQQHPLDRNLFPTAPPIDLSGMFYTNRLRDEVRFERTSHPEYRWKTDQASCLDLLPIYQTGAALGALCRCGLFDTPEVKTGFEDLLRIRGPGAYYTQSETLLHRNYTDHWCACNVGRWIRKNVGTFDRRE